MTPKKDFFIDAFSPNGQGEIFQQMVRILWKGLFGLQIASTCISRRMLHSLREDTHKKNDFSVVGPLRCYPSYTNGLVVHAPFFSYNSLKRILTKIFSNGDFFLANIVFEPAVNS